MKDAKQGGFLIAKIHQVGGRIFSRLLRDTGIEINPAQGRIMFVLWQNDGITIQELSRQTSLGKSTLTSMLDRLEKADLIERVRSTKDRRKILIQRTEKDKAFQKEYVRISQEMTHMYYEGFDQDEIKHFEGNLKRILDNLLSIEKNV